MVPPVRGVDHRIINGYVYISPVPVKDPEEIGSRVPQLHGARGATTTRTGTTLEAKWKVKMEATIRELEALRDSAAGGHGGHVGGDRRAGRVARATTC
jgi:pyruvate,water dikinase